MAITGNGTWQQLGIAVEFDSQSAARGVHAVTNEVWDFGKAMNALTKAEVENAKAKQENVVKGAWAAVAGLKAEAEAMDKLSRAAKGADAGSTWQSLSGGMTVQPSKPTPASSWQDTVATTPDAQPDWAGVATGAKQPEAPHWSEAASKSSSWESLANMPKAKKPLTEDAFNKGLEQYFGRAGKFSMKTIGENLQNRFGSSGAGAGASNALSAIVPELAGAAAALAAVAVAVGIVVYAVKEVMAAAMGMQDALQAGRMASGAFAANMGLVTEQATQLRIGLGLSANEVGDLVHEFGVLKVATTDVRRLGEQVTVMGRALELPLKEAAKLNDMFSRLWGLGEPGARATAGAIRRVADEARMTTGEVVSFLKQMEPLIYRVSVEGGARQRLTEQLAGIAGALAEAGIDQQEAGSLIAPLLDPDSATGRATMSRLSLALNKPLDELRDRLKSGDVSQVFEGLVKSASIVSKENASQIAKVWGTTDIALLKLQENRNKLLERGKHLQDGLTDAAKNELALKMAAERSQATMAKQLEQVKNKFEAFIATYGEDIVNILTQVMEVANKLGFVFDVLRAQFQPIKAMIQAGVAPILEVMALAKRFLPGFSGGSEAVSPGDAATAAGAKPMAQGGIVQPTPGGVPVVVAEAGKPEVILPIGKLDELFERHTRAITEAVRSQTSALVQALSARQAAPAYAGSGRRDTLLHRAFRSYEL